MDKMISCEFNIDTACVEVRFVDGSMISIPRRCLGVFEERDGISCI